jgi:hypothetical protein
MRRRSRVSNRRGAGRGARRARRSPGGGRPAAYAGPLTFLGGLLPASYARHLLLPDVIGRRRSLRPRSYGAWSGLANAPGLASNPALTPFLPDVSTPTPGGGGGGTVPSYQTPYYGPTPDTGPTSQPWSPEIPADLPRYFSKWKIY